MTGRFYSFVGGDTGPWAVKIITAVIGDPILPVDRIEIQNTNAIELSLSTLKSNSSWQSQAS